MDVSPRRLVVALALSAFSALGCSRAAPDATPDGALRLFLERMEVATDDPRAMAEAYDLLGKNAKHNLEERAARASLVQGKAVSPREMLAMGRFGLRFRPKAMTVRVEGDSAVVSVTGSDAQERADIPCVREGAAWRIEPELPPLSIQQRRPDGGAR